MKRDRVALILIMSALAGVLLALALPAHAADCPPLPPVVSMSWVLTLGSGAVGAGAGGYLLSGRARTTRRVLGIFTLGLGALGVALLASSVAFGAQESAAPYPSSMPAFTAWLLSPLGRLLCAGVVMAALEALKQWKAFSDAALSHPLARAGMALVLAVVAAVPVWATGSTLNEALTMVLTSWLMAMGINGFAGAATKKVSPP